jgi:hypothetical protein
LNYALNVNYKSIGKSTVERYKKAYETWKSSKGDNESKVTGLFSEATDIYEKSRSCNIQKSKGTITETINYTTEEAYDSNALPDGILKYKIQVSKQEKVPRTQAVVDLTNLKQKLITSNLDSLGRATVTVTCVASPEYGMFHGKNFLNGKTSEMDAALEETDFYGTSDQISIDLANGSTTRVINYIIA